MALFAVAGITKPPHDPVVTPATTWATKPPGLVTIKPTTKQVTLYLDVFILYFTIS